MENNIVVEVNDKEIDNKEKNKEPKKDIRDTLYGKINVSTKTMDKVIIGLTLLLIIALVLGSL